MALAQRGVTVVDPRQTFIGPEVLPERICAGAILHPGARIRGARTFIGPAAEVGTEGPATLVDAVLGERATVASGYVSGAVLLRDASVGGSAHLRGGTLLEEEASTAHSVGLKHTILLAFVTLGSQINFCDVLMTGGSSRRDHSEVGSGYIHFNFTPWGERGDKATPSLIGDVPRGVLLREPRIFVGGSGGMVGPRRVGFGAVVGAGSLLRSDVGDRRLTLARGRELDRDIDAKRLDALEPRRSRNLRYIGELYALRAWYSEIRRPRVVDIPAIRHRLIVVDEAIRNIDSAIAERYKRLCDFAAERGALSGVAEHMASGRRCILEKSAACPLDARAVNADADTDHVAWVRGLDERSAEQLRTWLADIVMTCTESG
ncbi:MAG TPA: UDP-N-acetylglucosamine pyrophosphorylase [Nannocystis exedens]|nr:UDP-N-acetylglucosamine pyrophosphorylase [Nannocystis exedens]